MRLFSAFLSTFLIPLVAVMPLRAELPASAAAPDQPKVLKIRLADEGKGTVTANSIVKGYAVLVTDASGSPVPDAAVAIRFPDEGATGFFVNGEHSAVAYTDSSGVARFPQINWGSATGSLSIRVTAVKGELHAGVLLEQTVVAVQSGNSSPALAPVAPFPSVETPPSTPASPTPAVQAPAPEAAPAAKAKTPGVPTSIAAVHSGAAPDQAPSPDSVSVVNTSGSKGGSSSTKKWVIVGAVLGAVGIGAALALAGKGGGSTAATAASSTTTIGTPSISVGH